MHTLAELLHRFALRNTTVRCAVDQLATPAFFFFAERVDMALLQHPHIQFAQARIGDHAAAAGFGDNFCCAAGSPQIAGNDMGDPQRSGALAHLRTGAHHGRSAGCRTDPEYVARRSTAFHRGEQGILVTCFFRSGLVINRFRALPPALGVI